MSTMERPTPATILGHMSPSAKAKALVEPGMGAMEVFSLFVRRELFLDAIAYMARMLPKREAVWWGCLCVEHAGDGKLPPEQEAALGAAVRWVLDPSEENRRAAGELGKLAEGSTAAGSLALSVFYSGGSLSPAGQPVVPPHPDLTAKGVTGAIKIAATSNPMANPAVCHRQFLALALEVAEGKNRWIESKKTG